MLRKRSVALGGLGAAVAVILIGALLTAGVSSGSSQKTVRLAFFNPIVANAFTASQYRGIIAANALPAASPHHDHYQRRILRR